MIADDGAMFTEEQGRAMIAAFDTFLAKWANLPPIHLTIQVPKMIEPDPNREISLDLYEQTMINSIQEFVAEWRTQNAINAFSNPDDWPLEMPLAEWDEQFITWCDAPSP